MPWSPIASAGFVQGEYGRYKNLPLNLTVPAVAWAVSADVAGAAETPRLRVGFMAPFVNVDDRQVIGPSEELFSGLDGFPLGLHVLSYSWLSAYSGLAGRASSYGAMVSPDRGGFPATFTLWRLT